MSFSVNSKIKLNFGAIKKLDINSKIALEQTTDALLTEIKNAQVMPFDTGNLQNENTFPDYSNAAMGRTQIVSNTPYARRLYFHPEFNFNREVWHDKDGKEHGGNQAAGGKWLKYWLKGGTRENFCTKQFAEIYRRLNNL